MFPDIETERLRLRHWRIEDAQGALEVYNNARVMTFINPLPEYKPRTLEEQQESLVKYTALYEESEDGRGFWAVEEKESGRIAGTILLKPIPGHESMVEVGWHLGEFAWGKGFATEGGKAALDYGFKTLALEQIYALVDPRNTPSIRVTQRLGLEQTGELEAYGKLLNLYVLKRPD